MREIILALNALVADGLLVEYAIGGAIGASFYVDALQTEDVDAFVFLPGKASGLVLLSPVYEALVKLGGKVEREFVRFGDWPLQILTDANELIAEAIRGAETVDYLDVQTRVFKAEHLCAIALQTGRGKDLLRVQLFLEQQAVDRAALSSLIERFGLHGQMRRVEGLIGERGELESRV